MRQLIPRADSAGSSDLAADSFGVYRAERKAPSGRPWILGNMVSGIDGSAAVGGRVGGLSSPRDRELFVLLRSLADAVLIGAATVRTEGYGPVRLPPALQEQRVSDGRSPTPPLAIVTRSLALDWDSPLFSPDTQVRPVIVTVSGVADAAMSQAQERADVVIAGDASVDLRLAAIELGRRGMGTLLTEGGPTLLGELMARDLLDELCLTLAPLVGGDPLPIAIRPDGPGDLRGFSLASVLEEDGHLFLRYLDASAR